MYLFIYLFIYLDRGAQFSKAGLNGVLFKTTYKQNIYYSTKIIKLQNTKTKTLNIEYWHKIKLVS